jgi:hypothetical protein
LEGCDELSCVGRLVYTIAISNTGDVPAQINALDFAVNGAQIPLLDQIETNPLLPGQVTNLDQTFEGKRSAGTFWSRHGSGASNNAKAPQHSLFSLSLAPQLTFAADSKVQRGWTSWQIHPTGTFARVRFKQQRTYLLD